MRLNLWTMSSRNKDIIMSYYQLSTDQARTGRASKIMTGNDIFDELFVLEVANNHLGDLQRGLKIIVCPGSPLQ